MQSQTLSHELCLVYVDLFFFVPSHDWIFFPHFQIFLKDQGIPEAMSTGGPVATAPAGTWGYFLRQELTHYGSLTFFFGPIDRWWQLKYFLFSPRKLGKIPILTIIFQLG